jgi:uncharacterized protein (DUF1684 family)
VSESSYHAELAAWQHSKDQVLRGETGWLTVVGLGWLSEGLNTIGSDPASAIVLPAAAPGHIGTLELKAGEVTFQPAAAGVLINGDPAGPTVLRNDTHAESFDLVTIGAITFFIIQRGQRFGVRVRDAEAPARRQFAGRRWFPIDERYRLAATFVGYDFPKPIAISNILGDTISEASPGYVTFTLDGQPLQLDVISRDNDELFFVFRDRSGPALSYPIRYLEARLRDATTVDLDFNRAYNPPCAFTDFATCTLPPPQNRLPLPIEAGEQYDSDSATGH